MYEEKQDLMGLFARLEWLLHRHYHQHRMSYGPMGNPHRGQGRVLSLLKMQPEITQKELTYLLDMRPQSLGELLAKMEQNGYITRTTSEKDRRIIDIKLTEAGAEAANQGDQQPDFKEMFDCLSKEAQYTLREYLSRIIDSLEQSMDAEQAPKDFDGHGQERGWEHHPGYAHGGQFGGWHGAYGDMDQRRPSFGGFPGHGKHHPFGGRPDECKKPYDEEKENGSDPHQD
jgi:DNA-binding MarR family transcriptional regulator